MFDSIKSLYNGDLDNCKNHMLYPIIRWTSALKANIPISEKCNELLFYIKPEIIKALLFYGLPRKYITKYPKKSKPEFNFLIKDYIKQYLKYSQKEIQTILPILELKLKNEKFKEETAKFFGLEPKEYKKLNLNFKKITKNELQKSTQTSLF